MSAKASQHSLMMNRLTKNRCKGKSKYWDYDLNLIIRIGCGVQGARFRVQATSSTTG